MNVYDNIKKISKLRGYSLQTTAEKAGLSKNVIYTYKKGKNPSLETLNKIAKVLGVTSDQLLGEKKKINNLSDDKIDITDAIHEGKILAYEGKEIPQEEVEMIRRIIEGRKHI
ncbi:XRE family transcriptional regulator [Bombilactobacillus bombi]|uniref:XRE family transcriptional regulator n=1 Tax=Bombilactobacillus bombi TaxID=1303590 RepID=A0A3R6W921_9LACO|nr:helix-turn-helix transcriptional regulator [Bombilactobacillus bombi]RHW49698.1 XRE family transcriptional regulator [Bombilactobacillus bombi]